MCHRACVQKAACSAVALGMLLVGAAAWSNGEARAAGVEAAFNYPDPPREGRADFFTIAEDGQARCVIMRPRRPARDEFNAADTLHAYLDLVTGADIPYVWERRPVPEGMGVIHVGNTAVGRKTPLDLPDVRYGDDVLPNVNGYLVKTLDSKTLVIRGQTDRATMLGVVGFLERYAGVRRYWPGNPGGIGDVIPKQPTLRLPQVEWRDWPCFISRIMSGISRHGPKPEKKYSRVRFDDFRRMNYTIPSNESYYKWLPITKYGETHPEYFPLIGGKRYVPKIATTGPRKGRDPHGWQPCVSNPEIVRIMADALIDYFRKNPDRFAINLAVNDGRGDCQCEKCRAMDAPGADISNRIGLCDRYVKFDNQVCGLVQKEFPNKIIAFIAYGSMREPPATVQLHPMLMPVLCVSGNTFEMWDKWMKMGAKRMGIYLYHDDMWFAMPKMDVHQSAKRIRYIVASGRARHFYQEFYGLWPLDGMVGYVESALLWDPRLDVDAILDEYYTRFYGPAAAHMKAFYGTLEAGYERWIEEEGIPHPYGKDMGSLRDSRSFDQYKVLNVQEAQAAAAHLNEAADACVKAGLATGQEDAMVAQRLDVVKQVFGFAAIGARQYWAMRRLQAAEVKSEADAGKVLADAREAVAMSRAQAEYKRDVMEKPPASVYAGHVRDQFYAAIKVGDIHPQVLLAVVTGFGATSDFLRARLGPERAGDWWRKRHEEEKDPALAGPMAIAEAKARGLKLANLVKDPSFEARGAGQAPKTALPLAVEHEMRQGLNTWHGRGTSMKCTITTEDAHTGKCSVVFWDTQHAGICETLQTKQGGQFHLSIWVKHNDKPGRYQVNVLPRGPEGMLARTKIAIPWKPDEWQEIKSEFAAPLGTTTISLYVFIDAQAPGAKIWIDDFFVGKYPE